ncbi:MAG: hypothetical protein NVSMB2_11790 [Chloroflexota bacterium]
MEQAAPREFTTRWGVRSYELDGQGHVNNSVYLAYAEELATLHAEAAGFGREWTLTQGGVWVVHRQEIVYHLAAVYGDTLELTTRVAGSRGARAIRETRITVLGRGPAATITAEWVWTRATDGRPTRLPEALMAWIGYARIDPD